MILFRACKRQNVKNILIRATTSAERYCNEEQKYKIMKSYFSTKPGATFFLGSSRTLVYHKDDVEIIYKTKTPSGKTYYAHVYLMLGGENSVTLYADWGGKTDW